MTAELHAVTPYGRGAGSSRVRVFSWLERLPETSAVLAYAGLRDASPRTLLGSPGPVLAAERRLRSLAGSSPARLLLHREASPLSRGRLERALLDAAGHAVYDFDDALQWDTGEGGLARRLAPKAPKALAAVRAADRVVAGNEVLADWASDHARDVVVIPSCVAPEDYVVKTDHAVADPPRLLWVGSRSEELQLLEIAPALTELRRRTGARLTVLGQAGADLGELEAHVDRVPWSEAVQHQLLATADVGLMPLRDVPMDRGKCGYKLLQYLAAGLPAVASPVGVNTTILRRAGLPAATTDTEWVDAVQGLLEAGTAERSRLSASARRTAVEHYSYDAWLPAWRRAVALDPPA